jgi:hypothetical protein
VVVDARGGGAVRVTGLRELNAALRRAERRDLIKVMRNGFRDIAKDVAKDVQREVGARGLIDTGRLQKSVRGRYKMTKRYGEEAVVISPFSAFKRPKRRKTRRRYTKRTANSGGRDFMAVYYPRLYEFGYGRTRRRPFMLPVIDRDGDKIARRVDDHVKEVLSQAGLTR